MPKLVLVFQSESGNYFTEDISEKESRKNEDFKFDNCTRCEPFVCWCNIYDDSLTTRKTHQSEFNTFEIESIVINLLEFKILPKTLVQILKGFSNIS